MIYQNAEKNEKLIILPNQTIKDIKNLYRDVGGYDMSYDEFDKDCRESLIEENICLCIDRSENKDQGR